MKARIVYNDFSFNFKSRKNGDASVTWERNLSIKTIQTTETTEAKALVYLSVILQELQANKAFPNFPDLHDCNQILFRQEQSNERN